MLQNSFVRFPPPGQTARRTEPSYQRILQHRVLCICNLSASNIDIALIAVQMNKWPNACAVCRDPHGNYFASHQSVQTHLIDDRREGVGYPTRKYRPFPNTKATKSVVRIRRIVMTGARHDNSYAIGQISLNQNLTFNSNLRPYSAGPHDFCVRQLL